MEKIEINLYDHCKTSWIILSDEPAPPEPTVALFDGLFLGKYKDKDRKFWHDFHSIPQFELLKIGIDIFGSLETMCFSAT